MSQAFAEAPLVLAIDAGTSSIRAILFDSLGRQVGNNIARVGVKPLTTIDGGFEFVTEELFSSLESTVDLLLQLEPEHSKRVELIAISCFWHSLVGVDSLIQPVTPVYTWADTRAGNAAGDLRRRCDERAVHNRTGCRLHSSYWPAKLLWLRKEKPELFARTDRWLSFAGYISQRLFSETAASISMASGTGLFNLRTSNWDEQLRDIVELDSVKLPRIAGDDKTFQLRDEYRRRWPSLKDAHGILPVGDGAAHSVGAGCTTRDEIALMIGTSAALRTLWRGEPPDAIPSGLFCYRASKNQVVVGGALSDGGGLIGWLSSVLAVSSTANVDAVSEPGEHGLTVLPFWAGERSSGWSHNARGAILGITMHTRAVDILQAVMEAIACRLKLIFDELKLVTPPGKLIAGGGALSNFPFWTQGIADALGVPVTLSSAAEASARGAALLALHATGRLNRLEDIDSPTGTKYLPDMRRHEKYLELLAEQQKLYEQVFETETSSRTAELDEAVTRGNR